MDATLIFRFFPCLSDSQKAQFAALQLLYSDWNRAINVISRKDIEHLYLRHVLHSLSLACLPGHPFCVGAKVLDAGTGGGFPGIPLAILFPETHFTLCDSIAKKIKVVTAISEQLGLTNVTPVTARAETLPGGFDVVVSRAVTRLGEFIHLVNNKLTPEGIILCLKGGDLTEEIREASRVCRIPETQFKLTELSGLFQNIGDDFFETKKICEIKQTSYLCAPQSKSN